MTETSAKISESETPQSIGFLLLKNFTMISLACAVEPLRMANQLSAKSLFKWKMMSEEGNAVIASDGIQILADLSTNEPEDFDTIIIAGGLDIAGSFSTDTLRWLKKMDARGVQLGGICTGAFVLAAAGLLDGYKCSVHWESKAAISELYPLVNFNDQLFTIDRHRITATGGTGPLDMMIKIIKSSYGVTLARAISEMFMIERIREESENQKAPLENRLRGVTPKLFEAIAIMEANIEDPIEILNIAELIGLSRRQLERLFKANLESSPSRHYMNLRLLRSRELLKQTNLSTVEIASLCGFKSTPHFSKCYREYFSVSPRIERKISLNIASLDFSEIEKTVPVQSATLIREPSFGSLKSNVARGQ